MRDISDYVVPDLAVMPASVDAERTILGAIMLDSERLPEVAEALGPSDFVLDSHRRIMQAMIDLGSGHIDDLTLGERLRQKKELDAIGGQTYVCNLTAGIYPRIDITNHIAIVKDKAICRALVAAGEELAARAYSQDLSGIQIASWAVSAVSAIAESGAQTAEVFTSADMTSGAEERLLNPPADNGILPFGIRSLDDCTNGGMRRGELWIVGAPPSRGKTTLARQIVCHTVLRGVPAYVHSGEMTKESWLDITACLIEGLPAWKVRDPYLLNLADKEAIRSGLRTLGRSPFHISDAGGISLDRLLFNATKAKRTAQIELFVIDYAQLIHAPGRDKREQVSAVAGRLREFAKEHNVATILLSQLARPDGRNINAKPNMFMLKESGTLEESAHGIIMPYMPVDAETNVFTGEDQLVIGKQRFGAVGSVNVRFNGEFLRFEER